MAVAPASWHLHQTTDPWRRKSEARPGNARAVAVASSASSFFLTLAFRSSTDAAATREEYTRATQIGNEKTAEGIGKPRSAARKSTGPDGAWMPRAGNTAPPRRRSPLPCARTRERLRAVQFQ